MDKAFVFKSTFAPAVDCQKGHTDVFGFGKKTESAWELIDTKNTEAKLLSLITTAKENLVLVTPWATLGELGSIRRTILLAIQRGVKTTLIIRDEDKTIAKVVEDAKELLSAGMNLYTVQRLHAKVYWSEQQALLTSANLIEGSFDKSVEFGLLVTGGDLHAQVRDFIKNLPLARQFSTERHSKKSKRDNGFCIRCRKEIPLSEAQPYCRPHYEVWAEYENPDYKDRYCHGCGEEFPATKRKPLCRTCFNEQRSA